MIRFLIFPVLLLILYDYAEGSTLSLDGSLLKRQARVTPKPDSRTRTTKKPRISKSEQMCAKYAESVFAYEDSPLLLLDDNPKEKVDTCAITAEPLIVGGKEAEPREFPHMALIGFGENVENATWRCGGSLISERFVLSAAHCQESDEGKAKWVKLGDLVTNNDTDDAEPITTEIQEAIVHPSYTQGKFYNDILLFKLKDKITFSGYVRPICLHTKHNITGTRALASGWGHTSWFGIIGTKSDGPPSEKLMKVTLNITDIERCNRTFRDFTSKLTQGINAASMLCAGGIEGKDTCQGDSGGPLQIKLNSPYCMYAQIGIVSFGGPVCGSTLPGVYTRVSYFVPWIEKIVWP